MSKRDPSRTTSLRRRFEIDFRKRLKDVSRRCWKFLVIEDELGLKPRSKITIMQRTYQFRTNPQKLAAFKQWLNTQLNQTVLVTNVAGQPWSNQYLESAYKKGLLRSYTDANRAKWAIQPLVAFQTTREAFIASSFFAPESIDKLQLLFTRAFDQLNGVSAAMSQQLNRLLTEGLTAGYGPEKIARNIDNSITKIDRTRARVIARTEVINAHAEGQLDGFKRLGIDTVSAKVEFLTAGDERVCDQCSSLEGQEYKVDEAHNIIPVHPNCRCCWIPVV